MVHIAHCDGKKGEYRYRYESILLRYQSYLIQLKTDNAKKFEYKNPMKKWWKKGSRVLCVCHLEIAKVESGSAVRIIHNI
jgi:hypothetical protein